MGLFFIISYIMSLFIIVLFLAAIYVYTYLQRFNKSINNFCVAGLCQNAEPGRRFHDFRNSPAAKEFESQRDDLYV